MEISGLSHHVSNQMCLTEIYKSLWATEELLQMYRNTFNIVSKGNDIREDRRNANKGKAKKVS